LKEAIEDGHLTDYQIITPLITDDAFWNMVKKNKLAVDKKISDKPIESRYYMTAYLLIRAMKEYGINHILTYNNTNAGAKIFNMVLEKMLELEGVECNCYYLTGLSSMSSRKKVIRDFEKDKVAIISSARIFTEGVDIPIVDGVCFVDNKQSPIDIIQSVGRALRLHADKEMSYMVLPTVIDISYDEDNVLEIDKSDFSTVKSVLRAMGSTDERIVEEFVLKSQGKQSYGSKRKYVQDDKVLEEYGGVKVDFEDMDEKIDVIVCDRWGSVCWERTLEELKSFMDKNNKRPSDHSKNPTEKKLGIWIDNQQNNYKKTTNSMKDKEKRIKWEEFLDEYSEHMKSFDDIWYDTLDELKSFMDKNDQRPSHGSKNPTEKKLGAWISTQQNNYKKTTNSMKDKEKRLKWGDFVKQYSDLFDTSYLDPIIENKHKVPLNQ
jgi:superfamily II DNA/RNA helicase